MDRLSEGESNVYNGYDWADADDVDTVDDLVSEDAEAVFFDEDEDDDLFPSRRRWLPWAVSAGLVGGVVALVAAGTFGGEEAWRWAQGLDIEGLWAEPALALAEGPIAEARLAEAPLAEAPPVEVAPEPIVAPEPVAVAETVAAAPPTVVGFDPPSVPEVAAAEPVGDDDAVAVAEPEVAPTAPVEVPTPQPEVRAARSAEPDANVFVSTASEPAAEAFVATPDVGRIDEADFWSPDATRMTVNCGGVTATGTSAVRILNFPAGPCTIEVEKFQDVYRMGLRVEQPQAMECSVQEGVLRCF